MAVGHLEPPASFQQEKSASRGPLGVGGTSWEPRQHSPSSLVLLEALTSEKVVRQVPLCGLFHLAGLP